MSVLQRRNVRLGAALATVVLAAAAGWVAGRQIRSPAEIAARTAPPPPSLITVPVDKQRLTSDVTARGTVRFGSPMSVALPVSALKAAKAGASSVVTAAPAPGATIGEGAAAMAISGRPVLVLQGAVPMHRDLAIGISGDDVRQLEEGLVRLGFNPGAVDGAYDASTATAVAAWFSASGWEPFGPTDEQRQLARARATDLISAQGEVVTAQEAVLAAQGVVGAAQDRVRAAERGVRAASAPDAAPGASADARAELDAAHAELGRATAAVDLSQQRVSLASARVATLASESDARTLGVQVPADEVLFLPGLPLRVDEVKVKVGELVTGPVMTVTSAVLAIDGALVIDDAQLVRPGAEVAVTAQDLGVHGTGVVKEVATTPGTRGVDPQRFYFEVTPNDVPATLAGASVVLRITVRTTDAEVLVVPSSALSTAADGTTRVQVRRADGTLVDVTVVPGLTARGLVAVNPVGGVLSAGDLVVIGTSS